MKWKYYHNILVLLAILCLCCGVQEMSNSEAKRSLKVLDSNLNRIFSELDEKPEFAALGDLNRQNILPFDFNYGVLKGRGLGNESFDLSKFKGYYQINKLLNTYEYRAGDQNQIDIVFHPEKLPHDLARLSIIRYEDEKLDAFRAFPTSVIEKVYINEELKLTISHTSTVEDNMPKRVNIKVKSDDLELRLKMDRTRDKQDGQLKTQLTVSHQSHEFMSGDLEATINYTPQGYFVKYVAFEAKIFDHRIKGNINYEKIDPAARDYFRSFNENSSITLREKENQIAKILITENKKREETELAVKFNFGKTEMLKDYLILIDRLYDYKI